MNAGKILIVDFDEDYINSLKKLLQPKGFQISFATDSLSGLEKFKAEKPDLVILESLLPKLNAFELCNKLFKEPKRKVPVIMLTAIDLELNKKLAADLGADGYMTKPFAPQELLDTVYRFLKSS